MLMNILHLYEVRSQGGSTQKPGLCGPKGQESIAQPSPAQGLFTLPWVNSPTKMSPEVKGPVGRAESALDRTRAHCRLWSPLQG
jgi:hypothetical protein